MSLEAALAENTKALLALNETQTRIANNQDRLIAGQQAAIDKIDGPKGGGKTPATPKKDDKQPAATKTPEVKGVSEDELKKAGGDWMGKFAQGSDERKDAAAKIGSMLKHFGHPGSKLTGPESKLDADQRKQAKFFIDRWAVGLEVDFGADYDFDGDPKQGGAAAEEDPLG